MLLQGSEIVVRTLMEQGVDLMYGYPGGMVLDIYDALWNHRDDIHHVLVAHEQGATHAADGYARATGKVGVCIATSGPGSTNLVTGIATAFLDSVPMVVITGNVPQASIGTDAFQEIDITGITLPITKHNYFVSDPKMIAPAIREAFKLAMSGRRGPVLVDIAKNAQVEEAEWEQLAPVTCEPARAAADDETLAAAIEAINAANRPFVYFGGGAISCAAEEEICELADAIDAPIGCSLMGVSGVASNHPRFLGMEGMHGHLASTMAMRECDCLIALGCRFNDRATGNRFKFKPGATIVHIDIDVSELSKNTSDTFELQGDLKLTLQEMLPRINRKAHPMWSENVAVLRAQEEQGLDKREGFTPRNIMRALDARLTPDTPVVTDVGQHQMWAAQHLSFSRPRAFITSGGLGTMGFGMGAAIGAHMGTGKKAVLVIGDGGFGMCLNEMATAVAEGAQVVIMLMENGTLGMVRQMQTLFCDRHYSGTSLGARKTDFVALARAFGADGMRASTLEELEEAFDVAFAHDGVYLINCMVDQDELVLPMVPLGGSLDDVFDKVGE
ncbi:MAG: biosynthetic-type acetolactate synthase large subunit [Coriobacteriales bacterium]|nr:biosynthetic-type acetolactate synthase large subunit [Coriobacteriales bacterium]